MVMHAIHREVGVILRRSDGEDIRRGCQAERCRTEGRRSKEGQTGCERCCSEEGQARRHEGAKEMNPAMWILGMCTSCQLRALRGAECGTRCSPSQFASCLSGSTVRAMVIALGGESTPQAVHANAVSSSEGSSASRCWADASQEFVRRQARLVRSLHEIRFQGHAYASAVGGSSRTFHCDCVVRWVQVSVLLQIR